MVSKTPLTTKYIYSPRYMSLFIKDDVAKLNASQQDAFAYLLRLHTDATAGMSTKQIIQAKKVKLNQRLRKMSREYREYLEQVVPENSIVVDTGTAKFTSQMILEESLNRSVRFYYWGAYYHLHPERFDFRSMFPFSNSTTGLDKSSLTICWDFIEFLMTSVEPPIDFWEDGAPVYQKNVSKYEKVRNKLYKDHISPQEVQFTADLQKIFGDIPV